ncbi:hypothetical protein ABFS82_09G036900 [Erythranthe guttata]|uniref:Pectinesterase inhibitor domain-containing protein n=1 Tax=Erythranthe guttata TaxID=4155 RepID=A0A022R7Z6_ERYGU|nr:hypothetical protein MIMGU_mgv1a012987mg [Erythranthe guttata]
MDSDKENFTISFKQTLLDNNNEHQQKPTPQNQARTKNRRTLFYAVLILFIIIASSTIFITYISRTGQSEPVNAYLSGSSKYYCHLTAYPDLCYESMSELIPNTTLIQSNFNPIFSASFRIAVNHLKNASARIENSSECGNWVRNSLSQLTRSPPLTAVLAGFDWEEMGFSLSRGELRSMKEWAVAAAANALKCEERLGVEKVKTGVEKARKCIVNSIGLIEGRQLIVNDFLQSF